MNFIKKKLPLLFGIILATLYLGFNLATINDYGVTWDYTYHFNAGLWHLRRPLTETNFFMLSWGPFSNIPSVLSYIFFYEKWHLLTWDAAYNLYSVVIGSLGIGILYFFTRRLFNFYIALFSMLILAFTPRYLGHLHNNMKDIPQAVFSTLALFLLWELIRKPNILKLIFAVLASAFSLNIKLNAFFVYIVGFIWVIFLIILQKICLGKKHTADYYVNKYLIIILYFILSPLIAYGIWSLFWTNPLERLQSMIFSSLTTTTNMPVLYFGKIYLSGVNIPWHYPLGMLFAVTPLPIIFAFIIGFSFIIKKFYRNKNYIFVLIWFFIPLLRFLKSQMIIIDDIRHFMEILFPFAVISGIGMYYFYHLILTLFTKKRKKLVFAILVIVYTSYLVYQNILYHPYQTSYYSELIGGIKGADNKFDIDFWAGSYKKGMQYLNKNAPSNAKITVAMAPDIAKLYLRSDLWQKLNLQNMTATDSKIYSQSDYTVILNRKSFFQWFNINPYINDRKPVYISTLHNIPLVSIYKN